MKLSIVGALVVLAGISAATAQEVVREFSWTELTKSGHLIAGEVEQPGNAPGLREQLRIDSPIGQVKSDIPQGRRKTVTVLDLKNPPVTKHRYALQGSIRYTDVKGLSVIAMWSSFANGQKYAGSAVPFGEIDAKKHVGPIPCTQGTSDWHPFTLWFVSDESGGKPGGLPTRITLDVEFAGPGTVYLSPVKLCQYDVHSFERMTNPNKVGRPEKPSQWWSDRDAGWIGGIGGSVIGLLGGLIGILGGIGKARRFVLTLTITLVGLGVVSFVIGVVAAMLGQPYAVYFPLLLLGGILAGVCGGNLAALRRRYEQLELRKMAAMDTR
jgi:hypothetical protein